MLFGAVMGTYAESGNALVRKVFPRLKKDMLCLADRYFFGYEFRKLARKRADLLWRLQGNAVLSQERELADGSWLSTVDPSDKRRGWRRRGVRVRVVEYTLEDVEGTKPKYRLITTIPDPEQAPAAELAALYHERREVETAFFKLKCVLRGRQKFLQSQSRETVAQEVHALLLGHFVVRKVILEAAAQDGLDPDRLSLSHGVRAEPRAAVVQRAAAAGEACVLQRYPRQGP